MVSMTTITRAGPPSESLLVMKSLTLLANQKQAILRDGRNGHHGNRAFTLTTGLDQWK